LGGKRQAQLYDQAVKRVAAATESDDGYLSASEIAALKLDADLVILSACNTAAGGVEGAEALSGLARAFFYAGARALLVSHWSVYSDATVNLITGAVSRMAADRSIGRAEAMRQPMLVMIDKGVNPLRRIQPTGPRSWWLVREQLRSSAATSALVRQKRKDWLEQVPFWSGSK
jgi:CHAT domain-containing protein